MSHNVNKRYVLNKKAIVAVILLIFTFSLSILAYKNDIDLFGILNKSSVKNVVSILTFPLDSQENVQIIPYKQDILIASGNNIKVIDMKNNIKFNIENEFSNFNVNCYEDYIIVSEKDENRICVFKENELVFEKQLEATINKIKVVDNNLLVLLKSNEINKVEIYDLQNKLQLTKSYDNDFVIDFDYSAQLNRAVVLSITSKNDCISSKVDYFDIKSTQKTNSIPIISPTVENLLASNVKIFSNGNIVLLGDNKVISYDQLGNENWSKCFEGLKLHTVNISSGEYIILEQSTIKNIFFNKRSISVLNDKGQVIGKDISIKNQISNIETSKDYFLVNDSEKIYSISNGELNWSYPFKKIRHTKAMDSKVLLVGAENVEVIEVN